MLRRWRLGNRAGWNRALLLRSYLPRTAGSRRDSEIFVFDDEGDARVVTSFPSHFLEPVELAGGEVGHLGDSSGWHAPFEEGQGLHLFC